MRCVSLRLFIALISLFVSATARADHFAIELEVKASKASKKATTDVVAVGVQIARQVKGES